MKRILAFNVYSNQMMLLLPKKFTITLLLHMWFLLALAANITSNNVDLADLEKVDGNAKILTPRPRLVRSI